MHLEIKEMNHLKRKDLSTKKLVGHRENQKANQKISLGTNESEDELSEYLEN